MVLSSDALRNAFMQLGCLPPTTTIVVVGGKQVVRLQAIVAATAIAEIDNMSSELGWLRCTCLGNPRTDAQSLADTLRWTRQTRQTRY